MMNQFSTIYPKTFKICSFRFVKQVIPVLGQTCYHWVTEQRLKLHIWKRFFVWNRSKDPELNFSHLDGHPAKIVFTMAMNLVTRQGRLKFLKLNSVHTSNLAYSFRTVSGTNW